MKNWWNENNSVIFCIRFDWKLQFALKYDEKRFALKYLRWYENLQFFFIFNQYLVYIFNFNIKTIEIPIQIKCDKKHVSHAKFK